MMQDASKEAGKHRMWRTLVGRCLRLAGRHAGQVCLLRRDDLLAGVARRINVQQLLVDLEEAMPPAAAMVYTSQHILAPVASKSGQCHSPQGAILAEASSPFKA